ncbi:MAG: quinone-interacting membrane-bound oxidoreductase complex subunit QmoC [Deltaproteobacteria bacterium]|nr:quinone-interacting membrane-bound oxidoreductase complex subunit QmoC [Deltaproteobacteria bacterium]
MAETTTLEPDLGFIKEVSQLGGGDLKKCYQCATCSVACKISPDNKPFPRKEMIAASWGLKDRLVADYDVWLCHNCGDCTTLCPRGAKPGDVMGAIRAYAVKAYSKPKFLADWVNDPSKIPLLLAIPAVLIIVFGFILNAVFGSAFNTTFLNFSPHDAVIAHSHFIHTTLVDVIMIPAFFFAIGVFAFGLKNFLNDIHQQAILTGKAENKPLEMGGFMRGLIRTLPTILTHKKFDECGENKDRSTAHLLVLFSFIGLFIVTNIFFVALYVFQEHGPYSQMNPVKWLANIAGVALIVGSVLLIQKRRAKIEQYSAYKDWYLLGLVLLLGVSGMGAELTRLAGWAGVSYGVYFIHLLLVFALFAYTPFSKLAHLVYRTVAMSYAEYTNRK